MADILNTISILSFVAAGVFAVLAIILWFIFKIPVVVGDLSGRTAKKSIEKMRQNNEKTGDKFYKFSKQNIERGKLTGTMQQTRHLKGKDGDTGLLNENMAKDMNEQVTDFLVKDETSTLNEVNEKVERKPSTVTIKQIDSIKIIHTEEKIEY